MDPCKFLKTLPPINSNHNLNNLPAETSLFFIFILTNRIAFGIIINERNEKKVIIHAQWK